MQRLGALVRSHRIRLDLTQESLAGRAGLSARALRAIEQGDAVPRESSLRRLAAALGLSLGERDDLLAARGSTGDGLWVGVLGPLSVRRGGLALDVRAEMQRTLLGLLALHSGQRVSLDEIVDVLWGDRPPHLNQVHVHVARLRTVLEPHRPSRSPGVLVVRSRDGYALVADVDLARFDDLVARARRAENSYSYDLWAEAVRCWRGPVLSGADPRLRQHPAAVAAARRRLDAVAAFADAGLALARYEPVVAALRDVIVDEPLHEGLHARLMLALAGSGEQAAALGVFTDIRARLADDLGVEPGAEIRAAHVRVLRQEIPAPVSTAAPAPAQLPLDVYGFAGRSSELAQLDAILAVDVPTSVVISAVSGTAGVGKTALAVHWAHRVAGQFPDGQLYVDLHGYTAGSTPLAPQEALGRFVRALGVPDQQVPVDVDEQAALYRSLLDSRRVLVLLDNASSADQVRPLLPGGGGSLAVVTSRDDLRGLVARHGARPLPLDTLTPAESRILLERVLGVDRVRSEPSAADDLAELCAHLPLALRIAAANILARPHASIASYAADLRAGDPLAALSVDESSTGTVRAAFDLSYATLPEPARRLFRLLGLVPGHDITAPAAAALAGPTEPVVRGLLDRLARAHLVAEPVPGRFAFHDLLRSYAHQRATLEDPEPERQAAVGRLLRFYLRAVDAAARQLYPQLVRLPYPETDTVELADARAWLDAERPNLVAAVLAGTRGAREVAELAWRLADALRGYFWLCRNFDDWLAVAQAADDAAAATGDLRARAALQLSLGVARYYMAEFDHAIEHNNAARGFAESSGWVEGRAAALGNLANIHTMRGELPVSVELLVEAVEACALAGSDAGQAINLSNLGGAELELGRLKSAVQSLSKALDLHGRVGSTASEAYTRDALGLAHLLLGQYTRAEEFLTAALDLAQAAGELVSEILAIKALASIRCDQGRLDEASGLARSGLALLEMSPDQRLEAELQNILGFIDSRRGAHESAADHHERALRLAELSHAGVVVHECLVYLGAAKLSVGRTSEARSTARRGLALAQQNGGRLFEGLALTVLGAIDIHEGNFTGAAAHATEALEIHQETAHRPGEARTHLLLGYALQRGAGSTDAARAHWRQAVTAFREMGLPHEVQHIRRQWAPRAAK